MATLFDILVILFVIPTIVQLQVHADKGPFVQSTAFDSGEYGQFVAETYLSSSASAPRTNTFYEQNPGDCSRDDGLLVMLTPRGFAVPAPAPMILDRHGRLVWTDARYAQPYNLQVQRYRDEEFLTFWAGDDGVKGHGAGVYYMLDSTYTERYKISAGNNLDGDLHEFRITKNQTALITVYQIISANLTSVGKSAQGWIWDGLFQEIDLETNSVLFQWRASDHIAFIESNWGPGTLGDTRDDAWDWFHINSVDKDSRGNYLVSSRWLHAVLYIDGTTGQVLWTLGGKSNNFTDLSGGDATNFASQHHARWHDDETSITLFDNSSPGPGQPSAGVWLDLQFEDGDDKTKPANVTLRHRYLSRTPVVSDSQGSMQTLPSGNVLVGYGMNAQYAEFSHDGELLCEVHFAPSEGFGSASVQSYRVMKFAWVGYPNTTPKINQTDGVLYISWNGATEVRYWIVEESEIEIEDQNDDGEEEEEGSRSFREVRRVEKNGFETIVSTAGVTGSYVRAVALDKQGNVLGQTRIVPRGELKLDPEPDSQEADSQSSPEGQKDEQQQHQKSEEMGRVTTQRLAVGAMALVAVSASIWVGMCAFLGVRYLARQYRLGLLPVRWSYQEVQMAETENNDDMMV
ncbi:hypothetical protein ABEF95_017015 [Exophiala dermatitidis]